MREFLVRITLADGSKGHHCGHYACGCDAVLFALTWFPQAKRISARRVS